MKSLIYVLSSKVVVLIIGILSGFVIPIVLSIEGYGYYQVFMLYLGYLWLFNLGFNDGIYLKYGGYDLSELPKGQFVGYFRHLFLKQVILMALAIAISLLLFENQNKFIFVSLSINILLVNLMSYFFYLFQINRKFKTYSYIIVLQKILIVFPIIYSLLFTGYYEIFIISNLIINFIICIICILKYREIVFGKRVAISKRNAKEIYSNGIPLLLGNFVGTLIFSIDKLAINFFYGPEKLAYYAFAVNMLVVILLFLESIYQVMYPKIKRLHKEKYSEIYMHLSNVVMYLTFFGVSAYFVFAVIIQTILPKYVVSLEIFAILIIGIMLRGENVIVKKTFVLLDKKQKMNFAINVTILSISIILNTISIIIFGSLISIAIASLISFFVWYIFLDILFLKNNYPVRRMKYIYLLILISMYLYLILNDFHTLVSFVTYISSVCIIMIFERKQIIKTYNFIIDIYVKK